LSLFLKFDAFGVRDPQILWEDSERALCRGRRRDAGGDLASVLIEFLVAEHPPPLALERLAHEHGLKDQLDATWAARPLDLVREGGRTALFLEDPGGEPLERLLGEPMKRGGSCAWLSTLPPLSGRRTNGIWSIRTSSPPIS
jgi:hypothetical protein